MWVRAFSSGGGEVVEDDAGSVLKPEKIFSFYIRSFLCCFLDLRVCNLNIEYIYFTMISIYGLL